MRVNDAGYPMPEGTIENPGLWQGKSLSNEDEYIIRLSEHLVNEIDSALEQANSRRLQATEFEKEDFPLPSCRDELNAFLEELEERRGFVLLRGLPIDRYSEEDAAIIFWGIGKHLGIPVSQNSKGHLLGHVRNLNLEIRNTNVRGYQTTIQLAHHNDQSDVIALLCRKTARSGGESSLVSVPAVHNEMVTQCPELLEELFKPFYIDRRGEMGREDEGNDPWYSMPILSWHDGLLSMRYIRGYIMSAQRFSDVPRLSDKQIEAMDAFDEIAQSEGMALGFTMQPGDIQMVNNYCVLHSRTSFEDFEDPAERRHMLRLWLCTPNSRILPPCFEKRFGTCLPGRPRGAIPPRNQQAESPAEEFDLARL